MNPLTVHAEAMHDMWLVLGAVQFFVIWAIASVLALGLVWAVGRLLDR